MLGQDYSRQAAMALASVSAIALGAGPANAQSYNWTGFYFGGNAGGVWGRATATTTVPCNDLGNYICNAVGGLNNGLAVAATGTGSMSGSGFIVGLQAGHNWQSGNFVYGFETDFGAFKFKASRQASGSYPQSFNIVNANGVYTVSSSIEGHWLVTARGRVGRTFNDLLAYATGGLAVASFSVANSFQDGNVDFNSWLGSSTKIGWTIGGGFEYALDKNWSVKGEYLYLNFGSISAFGTIGCCGYSQAISTSTDLTAHIARAGINFRF